MQGCSELVRELYYCEGDFLSCGKKWQTEFEFLWENSRDGRLKDASAEDIWLVMEGPLVKSENYPSQDDYIQSHVMCRMPVDSEDSEVLSLHVAISSIAIKENFMMDENDVDFNFENVEHKELCVHMACSRLRNVHNYEDWKRCYDQIVGFIIAVLIGLCEKKLIQKLFDQRDAQGRTILQILVLCQMKLHVCTESENFECSEILRSRFREMLEILREACVNTRDKARRTVLHWAMAHDTTWAVRELFGERKT
jgi:hypothetical protein